MHAIHPQQGSEDFSVPTFVIHLPEQIARIDSIREKLSRMHSLTPIILDAVDGRKIPTEFLDFFAAPSVVLSKNAALLHLTPGEIGCALSHLKALQKIVDNNFQQGLILEDDTLFAPNFEKSVELAHQFLTRLKSPSVVLFSARTYCAHGVLKASGNIQIRECFDGIGAYAYLCNREAAQIILRKTIPLMVPYDYWFWHRERGVGLYSITSHTASFIGDHDDSTLRMDREERYQEYVEWIAHQSRFRRLQRRVSYQRFKRKVLMLLFRGSFYDKVWPTNTDQ